MSSRADCAAKTGIALMPKKAKPCSAFFAGAKAVFASVRGDQKTMTSNTLKCGCAAPGTGVESPSLK
jgi:hypothetical protein